MVNALCIQDGAVVNRIVVESLDAFRASAPSYCASLDALLDASACPPDVDIGWRYDGVTFTAPPPPDDVPDEES